MISCCAQPDRATQSTPGLAIQDGTSVDETESDYEYDGEYNDNDNDNDEDYAYDEDVACFGEDADGADADADALAVDANVYNPRDGTYTIVPMAEISSLINNQIHDTAGLLGVSTDDAMILLSSYNWSPTRLYEQYWVDPEACLKSAGAAGAATASASAETSAPTPVCEICYDDMTTSNQIRLSCGHAFCRDCYTAHLRIQVKSNGTSSTKTCCPAPKCKTKVPDSVFRTLLGAENIKNENDGGEGEGEKEDALAMYTRFVGMSFIETNACARHCPAACCNNVAFVGCGVSTVACLCKNPFCFQCGSESHAPTTCTDLSNWNEKCTNESETSNWMLANTKKCPKCESRTEKNNGCNHMTCIKCRHEYCWICMGNWKEHGSSGGFYNCNKFKQDAVAAKQAELAQAESFNAAIELERYIHFYTRFQGHHDSMAHARKKRNELDDMQHTARQAYSHATVSLVCAAIDQVIECRRVLKYTYVMGYFISSDSLQRPLFEHHQEMLEKNTDMLAEMTEQPMGVIDEGQLINRTKVVEHFLRNLLENMGAGAGDNII